MDDYEHYLALRGNGAADPWQAACVTWVHGLEPREVARRFGADPRRPIPNTAAIESDDDELRMLVLAAHDDWVIAVEPDGFQGSRPEVMAALTRDGGRAVSVYWNENADNSLSYAVAGRVVTTLDMVMFPGEGAAGDDPHALDPQLAGLAFGPGRDHDCFAAGLTVGERISGVRLDHDRPTDEHLRVVINRPLPDDVPLAGRFAGHPVLAEPEIAAVLAEPTPLMLPAIAAQAARIAARRTGIETNPPVRRALAVLGAELPAEQAALLRSELLALAEPRRAEFEEALERARQGSSLEPHHHELRDEAWAITSVAAAFHPDPAEAAHLALFNAPSADVGDDDQVRLYVLRRCERRAIADRA